MGTRRRFTDEFKRQAIRLAMRPGAALSTVAAELGLDRSVLRRWKSDAQNGRTDLESGKPLKSAGQAEIEELRRELAKVKTERDILKKALGYFAKDPM